jgi:hypothetical protein
MSFLLSKRIILHFTSAKGYRSFFPFVFRFETAPSEAPFDFYGSIADNTALCLYGGPVRRTAVALVLILIAAPAAPAAVRFSLAGGYASALEGNDGGGWGVSAAGEFDLNRVLAVGLRLTTTSVSIAGAEGYLSKGGVAALPVVLFVQLRWPGSGGLRPYLELGGGYSFNKASMASAITDAWDLVGFAAAESIKGSPAVLAGAGCDFAVGSRLFLFAHIQALIATANGSWSLTDSATGLKLAGDIQGQILNALFAGFGLKYQF